MVEFSGPRIRNELPRPRQMKAPQQAKLRRRGIDEVIRPMRVDQLCQINNLILASFINNLKNLKNGGALAISF